MTMYGEFEYPNFTYEDAIREAGFTLIEMCQTGSYQGTYVARVEGGWLCFAYGSCPGCESIESFNRDFEFRNKSKEEHAAEFKKLAPLFVGHLLTDAEILREACEIDDPEYRSSDQNEALEFVYKFIPRGNA